MIDFKNKKMDMKRIAIMMAALLAISLSVCAQTKQEKKSKTLVAYFSASGVTAKAAKRLATVADADLFEIRPAKLYTEADLDWHNQQSRSSVEMQDKSSRPAITAKLQNMADYDVVFVGFPIWSPTTEMLPCSLASRIIVFAKFRPTYP
jgi:hypothetical protein